MLNYSLLAQSSLFFGIKETEISSMLSCLSATTATYKKGEDIYHVGQEIKAIGIVLSGSVNIVKYDIWGKTHILNKVEPAGAFAEAYAAQTQTTSMISVECSEDTEVLFVNVNRIINICSACCSFHHRLLKNLLQILAEKNIMLTKKIEHITPKSIRERVMAYLSFQSYQQNKAEFDIPFNRQELADYLLVERSALSAELSKMQTEDLISYHKNHFCLHQSQEIL